MRVPALVAFLALVAPAQAATFTAERLNDGRVALHMQGVIKRGDEVKFADALHRRPEPVLLLLASPGGDVWTSLTMGLHNTLPTEVRSGEQCASGCAMIWASGKSRFMEPGAHIGFHDVAETVDGHKVKVAWASAEVGAYYARLGYSDAAIRQMTFAPPTDMHWISDIDILSGVTFAPRAPTTGVPISSTSAQVSLSDETMAVDDPLPLRPSQD